VLRKLRIRTDDPAYLALCAGCTVCGAFPYTIAVDTLEIRWDSGDFEIVECKPFGRCHLHPREPRAVVYHVPGNPATHIIPPWITL
jgi:hypothetical protein